MMILTSAVERAILRVASRPPMPGILMSISTTSTAFARHHLTASSPHDASPTTFIPFISSRMRRIPARTSSWSSTSRTLIKGISPEIGITLLIVSHSYISGFYCNFETLKMVGIRFFSRSIRLSTVMVTPVTNGLPDRFTVSPATKCDKNYLYSAKMKISPLNM